MLITSERVSERCRIREVIIDRSLGPRSDLAKCACPASTCGVAAAQIPNTARLTSAPSATCGQESSAVKPYQKFTPDSRINIQNPVESTNPSTE